MNRRHILVAGVAVTAGAVGIGASLWRSRRPVDPAAEAFWTQDFDRPDGGRLRMAALRGRPLLLNFWATWCAPCVSEMPLLDRFQRANPDWQVAGLAVDNLAPVTEFLAKHPVGYAIGLANANGVELSRDLGNHGGALPFSVVFDASGRAVERRLGVISEADLAGWRGRFG